MKRARKIVIPGSPNKLEQNKFHVESTGETGAQSMTVVNADHVTFNFYSPKPDVTASGTSKTTGIKGEE